MATTFEYKGHQITVWTTKIGKRWDWKFSVPDFPSGRNDGSPLNTERAAIDEAYFEARAMIDMA